MGLSWMAVDESSPTVFFEGKALLATSDGTILGIFTGRNDDGDWFIDDAYYDGEDSPAWWLEIPPVPKDS